MKITLELELTPCMDPGKMSGHMHLQQITCPINSDGRHIGDIGTDPAMAVIMTIDGNRYHISGLDIWKQTMFAVQVRA